MSSRQSVERPIGPGKIDAGEHFAILARATHMPNGEAIHIEAVRLLQAFESHGQNSASINQLFQTDQPSTRLKLKALLYW